MRRHRGSTWLLLAALLGAASAACSAILGLDPPPDHDDGGLAADASDATLNGDGGLDGADEAPSAAFCEPLDATSPSTRGATFSPFASPSAEDASAQGWAFHDITSLTDVNGNKFTGGVFDGQYVYLAGRAGWVVRYDTTAVADGFTGGGAAWSAVDVSALGLGVPGGFLGAVFDGRFVYLVPDITIDGVASVAARFDTKGTLTDAAAWASFDLSTLSENGGAATAGFAGGVFDGRYVYFVPHNNGVPDGRVVRYDTALPDAGAPKVDAGDAGDAAGFANPNAWSSYDLAATSPNALGFIGGVFDGTSVYFVPAYNGVFDAAVNAGTSGIVARYALDASFDSSKAWSTFDMTRVSGGGTNFFGGAYDGRYVYFAPHSNASVLRLDTKGTNAFDSVSSWAAYDLSALVTQDGGIGPYYAGAAFDGRFVYFVPYNIGNGVITRFDSFSPFDAPCAWSAVDLGQSTTADGGAKNFNGGIFDGEYVYFVPSVNGIVARFKARTPRDPHPPSQGSFL